MAADYKHHSKHHTIRCCVNALRKERDMMCDYEFENYMVYRDEKKRLKKQERNSVLLMVIAYLAMLVALLCSAYVQDIQYHKIKELEAKYQEAVEKVNSLEAARSDE